MDDILSAKECVVCGSAEKLLRCSGCQDEYYCGKEHQKEHWKSHRSTCRLVQQRKKREKAAGGSAGEVGVEAGGECAIDLPKRKRRMDGGAEVGMCGIHGPEDFSFYIHALNNMAGSHKVDQPMKDSDENLQYNTVDSDWKVTETAHQLPNGLTLPPKTSYKRALGPLGHGILVQGSVMVGKYVSDSDGAGLEGGKAFVVEMDGGRKGKYACEGTAKVGGRQEEGEGEGEGEGVVMLPGSFVDGFCRLRGPLVYHGVKFDKYGGVHYNGCAFENGGYREEDAEDERRRYREVCIEDMVRKGVKECVGSPGMEEVVDEVADDLGMSEVKGAGAVVGVD